MFMYRIAHVCVLSRSRAPSVLCIVLVMCYGRRLEIIRFQDSFGAQFASSVQQQRLLCLYFCTFALQDLYLIVRLCVLVCEWHNKPQ